MTSLNLFILFAIFIVLVMLVIALLWFAAVIVGIIFLIKYLVKKNNN